MLQNFLARDMIEQITLLEEIETSNRLELLPGLMDLYATPHADQAVDLSLYHTLFALFSGDGEAVVAGLHHPAARVRLIAVRRAGADRLAGAKGALVGLLGTENRPELLTAVIEALGRFGDPELADPIARLIEHDDDTVAVEAMQALVKLLGAAGRQRVQAVAARLTAQGLDGHSSLRLSEAVRLASGKG